MLVYESLTFCALGSFHACFIAFMEKATHNNAIESSDVDVWIYVLEWLHIWWINNQEMLQIVWVKINEVRRNFLPWEYHDNIWIIYGSVNVYLDFITHRKLRLLTGCTSRVWLSVWPSVMSDTIISHKLPFQYNLYVILFHKMTYCALAQVL